MKKSSRRCGTGYLRIAVVIVNILFFAFSCAYAGSVQNQTTFANYSTIQSAINAATPGDILNVGAGLYNEHVVVNKTVFLAGAAGVFIDGGGSGRVVTISASGAYLYGLTIQNGGAASTDAGIWFDNASYSEVNGCNITANASAGIVLGSGNTNNTIDGNNIVGNNVGVWIQNNGNSDNKIYANNIIENGTPAIDAVTPQANVWDNGPPPNGGNYWGPVTAPYAISGGTSVDNYPLSAPSNPDFPLPAWQQVTIPVLPAGYSVGRGWADKVSKEVYTWGYQSSYDTTLGKWVYNANLYHWAGAEWQQVLTLANFRPGGVGGTSAQDVYASAYDVNNNSTLHIWRYNGVAWQEQTIPLLDTALAPGSGGNSAIVGEANNIYVADLARGSSMAASVLHFDGTTWQISYTNYGGPISAMAYVGKNEIYALSATGYLLWNGSNWAWRYYGTDTTPIFLDSVNDAWGMRDAAGNLSLYATGTEVAGNATENGVRVWKFTESPKGSMTGSWGATKYDSVFSDPTYIDNVTTSPTYGLNVGVAYSGHGNGIWGSSPSDIYVVGYRSSTGGTGYHFDGTNWSVISSVAAVPNQALAVWGAGPGDVWATFEYGQVLHFAPIDTTITTHPDSSTLATTAAFGFNSYVSGASFYCSLDGTAFIPCSSPVSYSGLAVGTHKFSVYGVDPSGNVYAKPATYTWSVITNPTITTNAGPGGTITPTTTVTANTDFTVTASANTGFHITGVTIDGIGQTITNLNSFSYTFTSVAENHTVNVTFAINQFVITTSADANLTITPTQTVNYGTNATVSAVPTTGYHLTNVTVDSIGQTISNPKSFTYTFSSVTTNHTVSATSAIDTFTITASAGPNGTVTPQTQTINYGGNAQTITVTPNTNYHIASVLIDGVSQSISDPKTFSRTLINLTANHTLVATFALDQFTITTSAGLDGTITPGQAVDYNASFTVNVTPNTGYHIATITIDGIAQSIPNAKGFSYTFTNVTAAHSVIATFAIDPTYNIAMSANAGGLMTTGGSLTITAGATGTFSVIPVPGYHIVSVTGCGGSLSGTIYTTGPMTGDCTITVQFAKSDVVFDDFAYLLANPDVAAVVKSGGFTSGWEHYNQYGRNEGRPLTPAGYGNYREFAYLLANPDVAAAVKAGVFGSGWEHYNQYGRNEGRPLEPAGYANYSEEAYLAANPDVAAVVKSGGVTSGWEHYNQYGRNEGRPLSPAQYGTFSEEAYLLANPDVAAVVKSGGISSGWEHYNQYGRNEGRPVAPAGYVIYNEAAYLAANPDVAQVVKSGVFDSGWTHYNNYGKNEGRPVEPAAYANFDEGAYLDANPDVAQAVKAGALTNGWSHYAEYGKAEGRPLNPVSYGSFNESDYLAANLDIFQALLSGSIPSGWDHYSNWGKNEGRKLLP